MRIAQIIDDKAHWIFEAEKMPNYPPDPYGNPMILVDITDYPEIQEGWDFNSVNQVFTEPEMLEPIQPQATELEIALKEITIIIEQIQNNMINPATKNGQIQIFNEESPIVKTWVNLINYKMNISEEVPDIFNLKKVVENIEKI